MFYATRIVLITLILTLLGGAVWADDRIAPPLEELLTAFDPDPKAEAQIIQRSTHVTLDQDLQARSRSYVAVYINSAAAVRDYSQIGISFNSHYEEVDLEFARVRAADGRLYPVRANATQIQSPSDENFYHDRKELLFSLPNVREGSVIEFQFQRQATRQVIPEQWFDGYSLHWWEGRAAGQGVRADAVHRAEIQVRAPEGISIAAKGSGHGVRHQRQTRGGQQTLTWSAENLPAIKLQDRMPRERDIAPGVRLSTLSSWAEIVTWADELFAPHITGDEAIQRLADDIAREAANPEGRVKAVYELLQDRVRYVFAHVGRGGYEPHSAFDVLANGYGDCKDQTVLAVTLLRKLGVEAYPALIATRSMGLPDMSLPQVMFDHMLVYLPAQKGMSETWLDTTGEKSLYPGHSLALEGQPALIIQPAGETLVTLPTLEPEHHYAQVAVTFDRVEKQAVEAAVTLHLGGMFEQHFRSMWHYTSERDKTFRELVGHLYPGADVVEVSGEHGDSLWQPFQVNARLAFPDAWEGGEQPMQYAFNFSQLLGLMTDMHQLHEPKDRVQDYVLDPGMTLRSQVLFARPSVSHHAQLASQGRNIDNAFFTLAQQGDETDEGYLVEQTLTLKQQRLNPGQYRQYHDQVRSLLSAPSWHVNFQYDKASAELLALKQQGESDTAGSQIAIARHYIRHGQFGDALEAAQQAVSAEPGNGEAHYVLGLTQGYQNLLKESDVSFEKAQELGYRP